MNVAHFTSETLSRLWYVPRRLFQGLLYGRVIANLERTYQGL